MPLRTRIAAATLCAVIAFTLSPRAVRAQTINPAGTTTTITTGQTFSDSLGIAYVNEGTLYNTGAAITETGVYGYGLYNLGAATISGGTITGGPGGYGVYNFGTATISGGTITGGPGGYGVVNTSITAISGGTISGGLADVYTEGGTVTITGGTFGTSASGDIDAVDGVIDIYGTSFTGNGLTGGFGSLTSGTGSFDWTQNGVTQTLSYSLDSAYSPGTINFLPDAPAAAPEPSAWLAFALGALGLGGLMLRARTSGGKATA